MTEIKIPEKGCAACPFIDFRVGRDVCLLYGEAINRETISKPDFCKIKTLADKQALVREIIGMLENNSKKECGPGGYSCEGCLLDNSIKEIKQRFGE